MASRSDNFNRANGAIGSPSDGGSAWSELVGTHQIVSNAAKRASGGLNTAAVLQASSATGDVTIAVDASYSSGPLFRATDASNWFSALYSGGSAYLYRRQSGSDNLLASISSPSTTTLTISGNGSAIKLLANSVQIASVTDSFNLTATLHGILWQSGSASVDNFVFNDTSAPASGPSPHYNRRTLTGGFPQMGL